MNENINLTEILKDCPAGTKLYSPLFGEVFFEGIIRGSSYSIKISINGDGEYKDFKIFTSNGRFFDSYKDAECMLFPSKEQRDWSKFKVSVKHKDFKPFDKVLVRHVGIWLPDFFVKIEKFEDTIYYRTMIHGINDYEDIIPYKGNEELVGKTVERGKLHGNGDER